MAGKRVKFSFKDMEGNFRTVHLAGDFTDWGHNAIVMKKNKKSGEWIVTKSLTPGQHEYKFIADGKWVLDPKAPRRRSELGGENSIVRID